MSEKGSFFSYRGLAPGVTDLTPGACPHDYLLRESKSYYSNHLGLAPGVTDLTPGAPMTVIVFLYH